MLSFAGTTVSIAGVSATARPDVLAVNSSCGVPGCRAGGVRLCGCSTGRGCAATRVGAVATTGAISVVLTGSINNMYARDNRAV